MANGRAEIEFAYDDGRTRLAHLDQSDPLRILFPEVANDEPTTGALVTTSGGLVGGDQLAIQVHGAVGTASRIVGQAAEKVYRSTGADVTIEVRLDASEGAWLEWLPQETILFDSRPPAPPHARSRSAPGARLLAGEIIVSRAHGHGRNRDRRSGAHDAWEMYAASGRLGLGGRRASWRADLPTTLLRAIRRAWMARLRLSRASSMSATTRVRPTGRSPGTCCPRARARRPGMCVGATCVGDVLVVRWAGPDDASAPARRLWGILGRVPPSRCRLSRAYAAPLAHVN